MSIPATLLFGRSQARRPPYPKPAPQRRPRKIKPLSNMAPTAEGLLKMRATIKGSSDVQGLLPVARQNGAGVSARV
ncbi:MAG: hypothetical protein GXY83_29345 [Rhodopirellula sp.]|nr:hypothetical protein [Rhodopirellula sp.]